MYWGEEDWWYEHGYSFDREGLKMNGKNIRQIWI